MLETQIEKIDLDDVLERFIREDPIYSLAVKLWRSPGLKFQHWLKALEQFREDGETQEDYERKVQSIYVTADPKRLRHFVTFLVCDCLKTEQKLSVREIAEKTGLTKSKVQRILTVEADRDIQTTRDLAFFTGLSVRAVRRILGET